MPRPQDMSLSEEQRAQIEALTEEGDIYSRLANSIAPGERQRASGGCCGRGGRGGARNGGPYGVLARRLALHRAGPGGSAGLGRLPSSLGAAPLATE